MEQAGFEKAVTAGGLAHVLGSALRMVPSLAEAPIVETWSNFRPTTDDKLPILGAAPVAGLLLATGHFRNGILLSPITAEIVRDLVVSGRTAHEIAPFSVGRFAA
jgi:glycine oxidase